LLLPSRSRRRYMPHAPPIVGRYGKRPHSRMRRLQLRTVHDLISSPRAFAGRAAPKERLVDSADVPAPRLTARGAQALLLVSRAVVVDRLTLRLALGSGRGGRDRFAFDDGRAPRRRVVGSALGTNVEPARLDDVRLSRRDRALGCGRGECRTFCAI